MKKQVMIKGPWDTEWHGPYTMIESGEFECRVQIGDDTNWVHTEYCRSVTPDIRDDQLVIINRCRYPACGPMEHLVKRHQQASEHEQETAIPIYLDAPDISEETDHGAESGEGAIDIPGLSVYLTRDEYKILRHHFTRGTGKIANPELIEKFS